MASFKFIDTLGEGSFGTVSLVQDKRTGREMALKVMEIEDEEHREDTKREIQSMKDLDHENVVKLIDHWYQKNVLYILMELCLTSLQVLIYTAGDKMGPRTIKSITGQLVMGLGYIHSKGIMHRDIKPDNALINRDQVVKIADFGLSRYEKEDGKYTPKAGTTKYLAPEMLLGCDHYSTAVDLWSLGCVIAELFLGTPLFKGSSSIDQLKKINRLFSPITKNNMPEGMDLPALKSIKLPVVDSDKEWNKLRPSFSRAPDGLDLAATFLKINPLHRQTCHSAVTHPFIADFLQERYPDAFAPVEVPVSETSDAPLDLCAESVQEICEMTDNPNTPAPEMQVALDGSAKEMPVTSVMQDVLDAPITEVSSNRKLVSADDFLDISDNVICGNPDILIGEMQGALDDPFLEMLNSPNSLPVKMPAPMEIPENEMSELDILFAQAESFSDNSATEMSNSYHEMCIDAYDDSCQGYL